MKLFISWSGERSSEMGEYLTHWIPDMFPAIEIFNSRTIPKGLRWNIEITSALAECNFGIFCMTPKNINSQWVNFEAGAISKDGIESRVFTLLLDESLEAPSLGPLSHFQSTRIEVGDIRILLKSINEILKENDETHLGEDQFDRIFERYMTEFWTAWEGIGNIPLDLPWKDNRRIEQKIDDIFSSLKVVSGYGQATLSQFHKYVDNLNENEDKKLEKVEPNYGKRVLPKTWNLKPVELPDGSVIYSSAHPKGAKFTTWEGYYLATGQKDEVLKSRKNELQEITKE